MEKKNKIKSNKINWIRKIAMHKSTESFNVHHSNLPMLEIVIHFV